MNRVSRENRIRCEYVQETSRERVERIRSTISAFANTGFTLQLSWKKIVTFVERRKCRNKRMQTYFDTPLPSRLNSFACGTDPLHPRQASKFLATTATMITRGPPFVPRQLSRRRRDLGGTLASILHQFKSST